MKISYLMVPVLFLLQACNHGAQTVAVQNYGTLLIARGYQNQAPINTCSIPIPAPSGIHTYNLESRGCVANSGYFSMNNVASAVKVWFYDQLHCAEVPKQKPDKPKYANHWTVQVETIKHPTTTRWVEITELRDAAIREVVVPGIQLISREVIPFTTPDWTGQLSCVKIQNLP